MEYHMDLLETITRISSGRMRKHIVRTEGEPGEAVRILEALAEQFLRKPTQLLDCGVPEHQISHNPLAAKASPLSHIAKPYNDAALN
jgi:hypothetical protein